MQVGTSAGPELPVQLRKIKIGKKSALANLQNALKNKDFGVMIASLYAAHGEARVKHMASQLFSAEGEDFEDLEQFRIELEYDCQTKSFGKDAPLTLQEHYMTLYGWNRAAAAPRPAIASEPRQQLKLYRTMSIADWKKLDSGDTSVLNGAHIGDFKQSLKYFLGTSSDSKVMVEFTLKPGAEKTLFSNTLALPKASERSPKLRTMATAIGGARGTFPLANTDQGTSADAIGVKSETEGEAGFSFGIGAGVAPGALMSLVESMSLKSIGDKVTQESSTGHKDSPFKAEANLLLHVNNCLINAICLAAHDRVATLDELTAIRSAMNNYGEMLVASPAIIALIRQHLNVARPISIHYGGETPDEDFAGAGAPLDIWHVHGNHFTHDHEEQD